MPLKYFVLPGIIGLLCFSVTGSQCIAAEDDTVTVYVVYTWKSAKEMEKYAPDPGPERDNADDARKEGEKMKADGRVFAFVVKPERANEVGDSKAGDRIRLKLVISELSNSLNLDR